MAIVEQTTEQSFNQRYYEVLRRAKVVQAAGRLAVSAAWMDTLKNYERRQYDELVSGFSEALMGRVKTHYSFEVADGRLVAADGEPIAALMKRGRDAAQALEASDDFYKPFLMKRADHECAELDEQEAMARGETDFNTMVAISPYTEELATDEANRRKLIKAAQRPDWRRAMVRLSHWDGQRLHVMTRSIDNSNLELLREAVGESLGYTFRASDSTAMLGERIKLNYTGNSWLGLPDEIVAAADEALADRSGEVHLQGRSVKDAEDILDFVESQPDIVQQLIAEGRGLAATHANFKEFDKAFSQKVYDYTALLEARLLKGDNQPVEDISAASSAAGGLARAEGKSYVMCGHTLSASAEEAAAAASGFETIAYMAHEKVNCPACGEKTTVPESKLKKGRLQCRHCQYEVDVCTGKVYQEPKIFQPDGVAEGDGLFEVLAQDLQRYGEEIAAKRQAQAAKEIKS